MNRRKRVPRIIAAALLAAAGTLLLLVLLATPARPARADPAILCVAPGGVGCSGPCWATCYASVQDAVHYASSGDEIRVATGVYTTNGQAQVVYVYKTVTIRGGYTTADWNTPDPDANPTTLNAEGQGQVIRIYGIGVSGGITPTLEGLRLTNGSTTLTGGGVHAAYAHPVISGCQVYSNTADQGGGGVYTTNSDNATLTGNTIFSNTASGAFATGGGVRLSDSPAATLSGNHIFSNTAASDGGGVYASHSPTLTLTGNHIFSNTVNHDGGGVRVYFSDSATLRGNDIYSNTADWSGGGVSLHQSHDAALAANNISSNTVNGEGGGVRLGSSDNATLTDNDVFGNRAGHYGGGVYLFQSHRATLTGNDILSNTANWAGGGVRLSDSPTATLTGNAIYGNTGDGGGGGVDIYTSEDITLINNMVVENHTSDIGVGAGVVLNNASARFLHTTLARNRGGEGQGIYLLLGATARMTNTILVSHTVGIETDVGTTATLAYTLWGTDEWANGSDTVGNNIFTGTLNWWGDPAFVNPGGGDYHITGASAAVDKGVSTWVSTDVDGDPRAAGLAPDLGADEAVPAITVAKTGPAWANQGTPITYTLHITNTGVVTTYNVALTDALPAGANFVRASAGGYESNGVISWPTFNIPPGGGIIARTFTVTATGTITNADYQATAQGMPGVAGTVAVVTLVNRLPVANAGTSQTVAPGTAVTLDGSGSSDPDGDPLTYGWTQVGGTAVTLSDPAAVNPTFTAPSTPGVLTFTLTVTDTFGLADSDTTTVTVALYQTYLPLVLRNYQ
jgi:uncharacterized repeat protein (TIGR01451 family)